MFQERSEGFLYSVLFPLPLAYVSEEKGRVLVCVHFRSGGFLCSVLFPLPLVWVSGEKVKGSCVVLCFHCLLCTLQRRSKWFLYGVQFLLSFVYNGGEKLRVLVCFFI